MVQGGLSSTTRTCGKPSCPCHSDPARRHGPHLYFTWRSDGKAGALYVPPEHAPEAKQAQAAWIRFREIGSQIAALNREQLRRRWARPKTARTEPQRIPRRRS
jgi:hypothetical protein